VKSPKVYIADSGLACHLLGIDSLSELGRSPFRGALFEGLIASEILKAQVNAGSCRELYHFRDEQGLEVDFVEPTRGGGFRIIECKATSTVTPVMAAPLQKLAHALARTRRGKSAVEMMVVYGGTGKLPAAEIVAPQVRALPWQTFAARM